MSAVHSKVFLKPWTSNIREAFQMSNLTWLCDYSALSKVRLFELLTSYHYKDYKNGENVAAKISTAGVSTIPWIHSVTVIPVTVKKMH